MLQTLRNLNLEYPARLEQEILGGAITSLLDVGCGEVSPIRFFSKKIPYTLGVDGFEPALLKSRKQGIHTDYLHLELLKLGEVLEPKSFDCVLASDVIEHLEKPDALRLIAMMETIARKKVILFTPNGFLPQGERDENPYQVHRSGWSVEEMQALGYKVTGINGWIALRGKHSEVKWKPERFWRYVSLLSQPLVRNYPQHAFQLLCVKTLSV